MNQNPWVLLFLYDKDCQTFTFFAHNGIPKTLEEGVLTFCQEDDMIRANVIDFVYVFAPQFWGENTYTKLNNNIKKQ
jgi:hypothetical protein